MNSKKTAAQRRIKDDVLFTDFRDIDEKTAFSDLTFHRVRGSVRLTAENVLLKSEINVAAARVARVKYI